MLVCEQSTNNGNGGSSDLNKRGFRSATAILDVERLQQAIQHLLAQLCAMIHPYQGIRRLTQQMRVLQALKQNRDAHHREFACEHSQQNLVGAWWWRWMQK